MNDTLAPIAVLCPAVNGAAATALAVSPIVKCTAPAGRRVEAKPLAGFIDYALGQTAEQSA